MSWKELPQSEYKITIFSWLSLMFEPIFALCACKLSDYHTIYKELIFDDLYYCLSMIYKNNGTNIFCQSMMQNLHFEW